MIPHLLWVSRKEETRKAKRKAPRSPCGVYLHLHKSYRKILCWGVIVFYSIFVHFINLSWRRLSQRGLIWIPVKMVHTSSLRGLVLIMSRPLLLLPCVFLPLTSPVWVLPGDQGPARTICLQLTSHRSVRAFLVLHNLMGLSDSGLTGFTLLRSQFICVVHEVAGLSGTSCLPIKCLSRSSTFKCHSCHLNELKGAKIKLKKGQEPAGCCGDWVRENLPWLMNACTCVSHMWHSSSCLEAVRRTFLLLCLQITCILSGPRAHISIPFQKWDFIHNRCHSSWDRKEKHNYMVLSISYD